MKQSAMLIKDECHANNALIRRENVHVFIHYKKQEPSGMMRG